MAAHRFVATHGVRFSEPGEDGALQTWAQFDRDPELDTPDGEKRYVFETEDADVAKRLRKVDDYGITEVTDEPAADEDEAPEEVPVPPKGGAGSGADAWAAYAKTHDVEVPDGASRDDIIAALEAAQVPTEKSSDEN